LEGAVEELANSRTGFGTSARSAASDEPATKSPFGGLAQRALINQALAHSIMGQVGVVLQAHFLQDTGTVRADGLNA
jgi:hypothetical protein